MPRTKSALLFKIALSSLAIFGVVMTLTSSHSASNAKLKIGYPAYWGSLTPALQHSAIGDAILAAEFEALVQEGNGGILLPGAASEWHINSDFTIFTFKIDTNRRFSNGKYLTASDFKKAWEIGLSLDPKSSNSSLQDVLYRVIGYNEFPETGHLSGIRALGDDQLEVQFVSSFRTALGEFATGRMSVFLKEGDAFLGTGPFVIKETEKGFLDLTKNPFSSIQSGFQKIEIHQTSVTTAQQDLLSGRLDAIAFSNLTDIGNGNRLPKDYRSVSGFESGHFVAALNGLKGRLFSIPHYRLAAQYLMQKALSEIKVPDYMSGNLMLDAQVYMPLQQGRIDVDSEKQIVQLGQQYVDEFIQATQHHPLYFVTSEPENWIQPLLGKFGVKFTANSGWRSHKDRTTMYYKGFEPDILTAALSVASGDPDGLYHALGSDGAIVSPMTIRTGVTRSLEAGRQIIDLTAIDNHYKSTSKTVLEEVPFIHIGYLKSAFAFNQMVLSVNDEPLDRESRLFLKFFPK